MKKWSLSLVLMLFVSLFLNSPVNAAELTIKEGYYEYTGESMVEGISITEDQFMLVYNTATQVEEDPMVPLLFKWGNAVNDALTALIDPNMKPSDIDKAELPTVELITYDQNAPFPKLAIVLNKPSLYNENNVLRIRVGDNTQFEWEFTVEENGDLTDKDGNTFTFTEEVKADAETESTEAETNADETTEAENAKDTTEETTAE